MNVVDALKIRTSIRAFTPEPVSEVEVRRLLEAARWAPSGGNLQPWRVIVVTGEAREAVSAAGLAALAENPAGEEGDYPIYPPKLHEPYRSRRYEIGEQMYALLGIPRDDRPARLNWVAQNYRFFGAPVGVFFVIERRMGHGQWAHLGMFLQSLALAAVEAGYGTCMQEAWGRVRQTLHGHFGLGPEEVVYCGMALGHPDPDAPVNTLRTGRVEVAEFAEFKGFPET